jgi:hypothetical protein
MPPCRCRPSQTGRAPPVGIRSVPVPPCLDAQTVSRNLLRTMRTHGGSVAHDGRTAPVGAVVA